MQQSQMCFVWGPPLTGQRRWVAKAIEETHDKNVASHVYFFEESQDLANFQANLGRLKNFLDDLSPSTSRHVYCMLPWAATDFGLELEDWIASQDRFAEPSPANANIVWGLNFVGLCPFDAEKTPRPYREGLEEFSRSARSDIIVVSPEENVDPEWLGTDLLDFGNTVEVFEEQLWSSEIDRLPDSFTFSENQVFDSVIVPLHLDEPKFLPLMRDLLSGKFGKLWNAELAWRSGDGKTHFLSSQENRIYSWHTQLQDFKHLVPENCALLEISGQDLSKKEILKLQDPKSFN